MVLVCTEVAKEAFSDMVTVYKRGEGNSSVTF